MIRHICNGLLGVFYLVGTVAAIVAFFALPTYIGIALFGKTLIGFITTILIYLVGIGFMLGVKHPPPNPFRKD